MNDEDTTMETTNDERVGVPRPGETVPEYLSRIGAAGGRIGGRATGANKVRGGTAHYVAMGKQGGAAARERRRLIRMGLLQIISTVEGRLADADGGGDDGVAIDPDDRANIELALTWLRQQAADPPRKA